MRFKHGVLLLLVILIAIYLYMYLYSLSKKYHQYLIEYDYHFSDDNISGSNGLIVPNIVHNILFGYNELSFSHFISLLSVLKNQKPDIIYIHCDCKRLTGTYYKLFVQRVNTTNTEVKIRTIEKPTKIFGVNISKEYLNKHASDITRLRILSEMGGIYLDNDIYVVKSFDEFRKYQMTVSDEEGWYVTNAVLIAHRSALFLKLWMSSYKLYDPNQYYYNAGVLPTLSILEKEPHLAYRLHGQFAAFSRKLCPMLYVNYYDKWRTEFYAIHLFMKANEILVPDWCSGGLQTTVKYFNETVIRNSNNTFSEMCRDLGVDKLFIA